MKAASLAAVFPRSLTRYVGAALVAMVVPAFAAAEEARWPAAKASHWYDVQPWLVGCNFLPSTAVNDVEMWQAESFDPKTIDRELGWAQDLGYNTVRVFINYVVWKVDAEGLKKRIERFLTIADRHHIRAMVILLDDCFKQDPKLGKQLEPEPGVHNSQWVASPGQRIVKDAAAWGDLESYVKDLVQSFAHDRRIVVWDLYNEPTQSLPLVEAVFRWARGGPRSTADDLCLRGILRSQATCRTVRRHQLPLLRQPR